LCSSSTSGIRFSLEAKKHKLTLYEVGWVIDLLSSIPFVDLARSVPAALRGFLRMHSFVCGGWYAPRYHRV
jgi:hypothetical protein